jgi:hypothetical protein
MRQEQIRLGAKSWKRGISSDLRVAAHSTHATEWIRTHTQTAAPGERRCLFLSGRCCSPYFSLKATCWVRSTESSVQYPSEAFSAEQSVKLILDYPVTLADGIFQLLPIEDRNVAANVTNRGGIMQAPGSHRHTFTAYA